MKEMFRARAIDKVVTEIEINEKRQIEAHGQHASEHCQAFPEAQRRQPQAAEVIQVRRHFQRIDGPRCELVDPEDGRDESTMSTAVLTNLYPGW